MHRPSVGMIPRYSHLNREEFNKKFSDNLFIFYAEVPESGEKKQNKNTRCRYETGIVMHIENLGQNIISVGHLRSGTGEKERAFIISDSTNIESLTGETIDI